MSKKPELELVLEGPEQSPTTADPVATLDLARVYFELLKRIATEHGTELDLRGLDIRKGSLVVASRPSRPEVAIQVMTDAARYISGALPPPPKIERHVEELRGRVLQLPTGVVAATRCGDTVQPLTPHLQEVKMPPRETTELRATVITVGGAKQPVARFVSRSEERPFSLRTEVQTARRLGQLLYSAVDLTAVVQRDEKGFIHAGVLEDFTPVATNVDEVRLWREWFRKAGPEWTDADDLDQETERV